MYACLCVCVYMVGHAGYFFKTYLVIHKKYIAIDVNVLWLPIGVPYWEITYFFACWRSFALTISTSYIPFFSGIYQEPLFETGISETRISIGESVYNSIHVKEISIQKILAHLFFSMMGPMVLFTLPSELRMMLKRQCWVLLYMWFGVYTYILLPPWNDLVHYNSTFILSLDYVIL